MNQLNKLFNKFLMKKTIEAIRIRQKNESVEASSNSDIFKSQEIIEETKAE